MAGGKQRKTKPDMRNAVMPTGQAIGMGRTAYRSKRLDPKTGEITEVVRSTVTLEVPEAPFCHVERDAVSVERIGQGDLKRGWQEGREVGTGFRAVSTLVLMHDAKTIDDGQLRAGTEFRERFDVAQLGGMKASALAERVGGSSASPHLKADAVEDARAWVHEQMLALGGHGSNMGDVCWHIVGIGMSISEYAAKASWRGKHPHKFSVSAHVEAALAILALRRARRREAA